MNNHYTDFSNAIHEYAEGIKDDKIVGTEAPLKSLIEAEKTIRLALLEAVSCGAVLPDDQVIAVTNRIFEQLGPKALHENGIDQSDIESCRNPDRDLLDSLISYFLKKASFAQENIIRNPKRQSVSEVLDSLGVRHISLGVSVLKSAPKPNNNPKGEKEFTLPLFMGEKLPMLLEILREIGVFTEDLFALKGCLKTNSLQLEPYIIFEIPKLNKIILINRQYGEGSFVLDMVDRWVCIHCEKKELVDHFGAKEIRYNKDTPEKWRQKMIEALSQNSVNTQANISLDQILAQRQLQYESVPFDSEYFQSPDRVRTDLIAFAKEVAELTGNEEFVPPDLSVNFLNRVNAPCTNGKKVNGSTYLRKAGNALNIDGGTLQKLLETAGFVIMDKKYFSNPEFVQADLEAFLAEASGKFEKPINSIDQLTVNALGKIICSSGRVMFGVQYLSMAARAFGHDQKELTYPQLKATLKKLIELSNSKVLNEEYFNNPENIRADLLRFLNLWISENKLKDEIVPQDIPYSKFKKLSAFVGTGRLISGREYLSNFAVAKKLAKTKSEAEKISGEIYWKLLEIAGFRSLNSAYFSDPNAVMFDLQGFARTVSVPLAELKQKMIDSVPITLSNGQVMNGRRYCSCAAIALGFCEKAEQASGFRAKTFSALMELIKN